MRYPKAVPLGLKNLKILTNEIPDNRLWRPDAAKKSKTG